MLIVSLAVSDFLVAICVMSFGVYYERNDFKWNIGQFFCNLYLASDVTCSTASILNLLAISLDRYIAISHPISYAQYGARGCRAMISISIVWGVSVIVGLPILLGVNPMEENLCELSNAYFNILSSLLSFFFPCTAMIVLYTVIFRRLRQRGKARSLRQVVARAECKTSLFSTHSDSSENMSTLSPLANGGFCQSTTLSNVKHKHLYATCNSCRQSFRQASAMNKDLQENPERIRGSPVDQEFYTKGLNHNATQVLRSYGDSFTDTIPYIDGVSCRSSLEDLSNDVKPAEQRHNCEPTQRSANMPMRNKENNSSSRSQPYFNTGRRSQNNGFNSTPFSAIMFHMSTSSVINSILRANSKQHHGNKEIRKEPLSTKLHLDLVNSENGSFADSIRLYKDQLWKRVTNGWKSRPSRQLVKKANKQMRREHKATVTLAVVLAVFLFCWLPFFTLHLTNSICLINARDDGCMGVLPLFLATWLGYMNSSLNPLIYTVFDQRFRNAFRAILCRGAVVSR